MKTRTLNGAWTLEIPGTPFAAVPATVPGSVYHDLLAAERIPDPFYRDNEMEALKLMDNDFVYFRSFQVDDALLAGDKVLLRAEGLDPIAAVHINGQIVGEACNMHRIWEFDVKSVLHPGENTITVSFRSPTKYIKEAYAKSVADGSSDAMVGFPNIRKAHCMFGWDWGPRLPDAGIWRNISIISIEKARIQDNKDLAKHAITHMGIPLQEVIEVTTFYNAIGAWDDAVAILDFAMENGTPYSSTPMQKNAVEPFTASPLLNYMAGWYSSQAGHEDKALDYYRKAAEMSPDYCFTFRVEELEMQLKFSII